MGLYIGWIGRAQCSLEPYEPSRVGQRESLRIKTPTNMERLKERKFSVMFSCLLQGYVEAFFLAYK